MRKRNREKEKAYAKKKREEGQEIVYIQCKECGKDTPVKKYKLQIHLKNGKYCDNCRSKKYSETMKITRSKETKEERINHGKIARSKRTKEDLHNATKKQWETIRSYDKKEYNEFCENRSNRMKDVWLKYDDDKKNKILKALYSSNTKSRSVLSENIKKDLIENKCYDGFVSEEGFHGFFPDEINHELKLIIEVFGDLYHCNPKFYKNPEEYISAIQRTVGDQWKRDRIRLACFYKHGYTVLIIWETDYRSHRENSIQRIKNEIDKKRNLTRTI